VIYVTERKVAGSLGLKLLPRSGAVQPELERPTHYFWLKPGFGCGTRRDVQRRLNKLGFDVHASGRFDDETRTVIKRWQAARGYPSTGFLNKAQHTALLSENLASRAPEEDDSAPSSVILPRMCVTTTAAAVAGTIIAAVAVAGALLRRHDGRACSVAKPIDLVLKTRGDPLGIAFRCG
jgi:peptidoglycan hydrolase-like protein with peptidoglycan-binding domain